VTGLIDEENTASATVVVVVGGDACAVVVTCWVVVAVDGTVVEVVDGVAWEDVVVDVSVLVVPPTSLPQETTAIATTVTANNLGFLVI
jgi:hypothetical protein